MAGRLTLLPEVVRSRDEPAAEILLPDPVDGHARGKRIVTRKQPACQVQAGRCPTRCARQRGRCGRADLEAKTVPASSDAQEGRLRIRILVYDASLAALRVLSVQFLELARRFREAQFLGILVPDNQAVGSQEVIGDFVALPPSAVGGRNSDDLLAAIRVQAEFLPR